MDAQKKADLKVKIAAEIEKLKIHIVDLKEQTKPISPENSLGRLTRMDAINNKSLSEEALRKSELKLKNLETALIKIDEEDFGICFRCKNPIPEGRLMLMPDSRRCVGCAGR